MIRVEWMRIESMSRTMQNRSLLLVRSITPRTTSCTSSVAQSVMDWKFVLMLSNSPPTREKRSLRASSIVLRAVGSS